MKFIVEIKDSDYLQDYDDLQEEKILKDFIKYPQVWIAIGEVKLEK